MKLLAPLAMLLTLSCIACHTCDDHHSTAARPLEASHLANKMSATIIHGPDFFVGLRATQRIRIRRVLRMRGSVAGQEKALDFLRVDVRVRQTRVLEVSSGRVIRAAVRYDDDHREDSFMHADGHLPIDADVPQRGDEIVRTTNNKYVGYDFIVADIDDKERISNIAPPPARAYLGFPERYGVAVKTFVLFHRFGTVGSGSHDEGIADRIVQFLTEEVDDLDETWHDPGTHVDVEAPRVQRSSSGEVASYDFVINLASSARQGDPQEHAATGCWRGELVFGRHGLPVRFELDGEASGAMKTRLMTPAAGEATLKLSSTWQYELPEGKSWRYELVDAQQDGGAPPAGGEP